jgi:hypothetical protein
MFSYVIDSPCCALLDSRDFLVTNLMVPLHEYGAGRTGAMRTRSHSLDNDVHIYEVVQHAFHVYDDVGPTDQDMNVGDHVEGSLGGYESEGGVNTGNGGVDVQDSDCGPKSGA